MCQPLFIIDVSAYMQQVAIIFLLDDTTCMTLQMRLSQLLLLLLFLLCPEMLTILGRRHFCMCKVMQTLCADSKPLIPCLGLVAPFVCSVCLMLL